MLAHLTNKKLLNKQLIGAACASTLILLSAACSKPSQTEVPTVSDSSPSEEAKPADSNAVRPNIVFILADDIGFGDLGVNGQKNFATPNLDQMAKEGINFQSFYAGSAVCGPSRSVLMTGLHTGHTPIRANTMTIKRDDGKVDIVPRSFTADEVTVAEVLQKAGYQTALVGKWGLGEIEDTGHPNKKGFDYFYGMTNHIHAHNHYPGYVWRNSEKVTLKNEPIKAECSYCWKFGFEGEITPLDKRIEYVDSLFRDEAVAYIERAAKKEEPFFLFFSMISPHANNEAERVDWADGMEVPSYGEYESKDWPDTAKGYAAMMQHVDDSVGQVIAKLKELGLDKNTIVMFSGDNGPHFEGGNNPHFHDSNANWRGIKRDLYEGGLRMPTVAWGPGLVPSGVSSDHVGYFGDVMETFAELAGTDAPDGLDSLSFANELLGKSEQQKDHDYIYWEFHLHGSSQALRMGDWKAIRLPLGTGPIEIYNLKDDPNETKNLAAEQPELVARAEKLMAENYVPHPNWPPSTSDQSPDRTGGRVD